ncbi:ferredoxin Fer [Halorussus amylolyticus]|uniref:ferredoxin Fer n=1 Tax=Halorussus amylolyticus TaxID=1126242 RepID=UPI00104C300D|nr:ferredoxin Fer [Halorussus amylolyticus]
MDSPLAVLGLDADPDDDELRRAYRERVKEAHPDHGGSAEEFRAVRDAYEQLKAGTTTGPPARDATHADDRDADESGDGDGDADTDPRSEVTYLNYDVLTDYGWETTDDDLFEKAAAADLDATDFGRFEADPTESLLEAAENRGFAWPFACRGGACANCAIVLFEGELSMPGNHVLPAEMMDRDVRLSCNGTPVTDELKVIYNVKHMPELEDLLLPPRPFKQAYPGD